MNKTIFTTFVALFVVQSLLAEDKNPVVLKINNVEIHKTDVEWAYKNRTQTEDAQKESIADFIKYYTNFRLNVTEAKSQKLDTTASYKRDYTSYRLQLSPAYLKDTIGETAYMKALFARFLQNVELNHVLLPFSKSKLLPADTLESYNQALKLRQQLMKNGFNGEGYRKGVGTNAVMNYESVNGYIGWIQPLMLSMPVENVAYSLPVGQVSMPIRTQKGYHIIQVLNRLPAKTPVKVEQVVFNFPTIPPSAYQIDSVRKIVDSEYKRIRSAKDFQDLCDDFSRAYQTGDKGCDFGLVNLSSQLPQSFVYAALALDRVGEISTPVMSDYGFHVIRLKEKYPQPTFEEMQPLLKKLIREGDRILPLVDIKREYLAKEFGCSFNKEAYDRLKLIANELSPVDDGFVIKVSNNDDVLFSIGHQQKFKVKDFIVFIQSKIKQSKPSQDILMATQTVDPFNFNLSTDYLRYLFNQFVFQKLTEYDDLTLEQRHPEFRLRMDNFSDGLLYYAVNKSNIWDKASSDEKGLTNYFEEHRNQYKLAEKQYKGVVFYCKNEEVLNQVGVLAKDQQNKLDQLIQAVDKTINKQGQILVQMEPGSWAKGANPFVDYTAFGGTQPAARRGFPFFTVVGKFIESPEDYTDVRNAVEADYQQLLAERWNDYLNAKYKVEINQAVLKTIK